MFKKSSIALGGGEFSAGGQNLFSELEVLVAWVGGDRMCQARSEWRIVTIAEMFVF